MKTLCDLFTPSSQISETTSRTIVNSSHATTSTTSLSVLSSDPLQALAQITGAGTFLHCCGPVGGNRKTASPYCAQICLITMFALMKYSLISRPNFENQEWLFHVKNPCVSTHIYFNVILIDMKSNIPVWYCLSHVKYL